MPNSTSDAVPPSARATWVVHDGAAGNQRQAAALAAALGLSPIAWAIRASAPTRWLAPRRWPGSETAFGAAFSQALSESPPALVIGCGRQAALATRLARAQGARVVQILDPRMDPRHWDVVIAPEHDGLRGPNVVTLAGSLNPIDDVWLTQARGDFPALGALPGPKTAILLGGPTRATAFDRSAFEVLTSKLEFTLAQQGGSVMICGSRRTLPEVAALARERYRADAGVVWMDATDGPNVYAGALAWADRIIVSPDSVNMISEACATTVPVFIAEPRRATGRIRTFIAALEAAGRIRPQERVLPEFAATPLRETGRVAEIIRRRLSLG